MLRRVVRKLVVAALIVAALAFPLAFAVDALAGGDYWLVGPIDGVLVPLRRADWKEQFPDGKSPDADVAEVYGSPLGRTPVRVLFASKDRIVRPEERPGMTILLVDKTAYENPLQAQTVRYLARWATIVAAVAGFLGLGLLKVWKDRATKG